MIQPFVIAGPSGIGKTFLLSHLVKNYPFKNVLSTMTRKPREHEVNMVDNEFLTEEQYETDAKNGAFFTDYNFFGTRYGYRRKFIEDIVEEGFIPAIIFFTPLIQDFVAAYPDSIRVFLMPGDDDLLVARMRERGDSPLEIRKRLASMREEVEAFEKNKQYFTASFPISNDEDVYEVVKFALKSYGLQL